MSLQIIELPGMSTIVESTNVDVSILFNVDNAPCPSILLYFYLLYLFVVQSDCVFDFVCLSQRQGKKAKVGKGFTTREMADFHIIFRTK